MAANMNVECMVWARGPGQEEWALVARRAAEEAARRRSRSRSSRGKTSISPLRSLLRDRGSARPLYAAPPIWPRPAPRGVPEALGGGAVHLESWSGEGAPGVAMVTLNLPGS